MNNKIGGYYASSEKIPIPSDQPKNNEIFGQLENIYKMLEHQSELCEVLQTKLSPILKDDGVTEAATSICGYISLTSLGRLLEELSSKLETRNYKFERILERIIL
jgi:hypothetical protein